ncbi:MAG: hypothetical protein NDI75_15290 [Candidatus Didemnitutus sp.]|nr:hypothetical protein [Candidatus Didemnitutus sp.]
MKITQKRFGGLTTFEIKDADLIVEQKSFGTKGRMKIPLAFIGEEYSEHQERSRGWILLSVLCGLFSAALVAFAATVEQEARGPVLGLAIILGVIAGLSVRSHVLRNVDGFLFVRADTGGVFFMHRGIPSQELVDSFVARLLESVRAQKKKADPVGTDNDRAAPRRV